MAIINGTDDDDVLIGTDSADVIRGFAGNDVLDGGRGADTLYGSTGDDTYIVDNAGDVVTDIGGLDTVKSRLLTYTLAAGVENLTAIQSGNRVFTGNDLGNTIIGGTKDDQLHGGAGDDVLDGRGAGHDVLNGGDGFDRAILNYGQASAGLRVENGIVKVGSTEVAVLQTIEAVTLTGSRYNDFLRVDGTDSIVKGGSGNDDLYDAGGSNTLNGGDGDDYIESTGGVDVIDGGRGNDFMRLYRTDLTIDLELTFNPGGVNQLQDGTTFKGIESFIIYSGSGNDHFDGHLSTQSLWFHSHGGDDTLIGGSARDFLLGYDGNDLLEGGAGDDILDGGDGADIMNGGTGDDEFWNFLNGSSLGDKVDGGDGHDVLSLNLSDVLEDIVLAVNFGQGIVNTLVGGTSFTNIEGLVLMTGWGDDEIAFSELPNGEWDGNRGSDHGIIDLSSYDTSATFIRLGSTYAADRLQISINNNTFTIVDVDTFTITGGSGADRIVGSVRADEFTGGGGNDVFWFSAGDGRDTIFDFTDRRDKIDVSAYGYHSLDDMFAAGGEIHGGADTVVNFNAAGDWVRLENFLPGNLTAADFIFA